MTGININTLENLVMTEDPPNSGEFRPISFQEFKDLHAVDQNRASTYFTALKAEAYDANLLHVENHAILTRDMVNNGSVSGNFLNYFTNNYAEAESIDFSPGSDARLQMQYRLILEDFNARKDDINNGGSGELDFRAINEINEIALNAIGLPPEASFFYTPLTIAGEHDPARAQTLYQTTIANNGVIDTIQDAMLLGFGSTISSEQSLSEILNDYAAQAEWLSATMEAMQDFVTDFGPEESTELTGRLETYQQLLNLAGATSGGLSQVADWIDSLPPGATQSAIKALPLWMQALIGVFDDLIAAASPLVLDIDGGGIELAALNGAGSVYWDIDLDGFGEASGWIAGGDGLLAIDLNADGVINDHAELFGDQTGSPNGFVALAAYDTNTDTAITSADAQFDDLLVWVDANANGRSEGDELHTLDDLGITSISLSYSNVNYTISGNEIKQESSFVINGQTRDIVDAWFAYDETNTSYAEGYQLDVATLYLPSLRGFGELPDLHIAMSQDQTLLGMVEEVATADIETILSSAFDIKGKVENILFRWAGVDGVDPASRGGYIDARKMEFIEEILGREWVAGGQTDPQAGQADDLDAAFSSAFAHVFGHILVQTSASAIYSEYAGYDIQSASLTNTNVDEFVLTDAFSANVNGSSGDEIFFYTPSEGAKRIYDAGGTDKIVIGDGIGSDDVRLWKSGSDLWIYMDADSGSIEIDNHFQTAYENEIETLILADGTTIDLLNNLTFTGTSAGGEYVLGTSDGDDTLIGMGGNDTLRGYTGNDTYVWNIGDGTDTIEDQGGTADVLAFGPSITADDVRFWKSGSDLMIYIGSESIKIDNQFHAAYSNEIETATFANDTTIDLLANLTFTGTSANEYVLGLTDSDDTLIGMGGNDTLRGYTGNDTYIWNIGDGIDTIDDQSGTADVLTFGPNIAVEDVRFWKNASDLMIYIGSESIKVKNHFHATYGQEIETATFADDTTIDLLNNLTLTGTSAGEYVNGSEADDTLVGMGGNDTVRGYGGNDVLIGSDGADALYGGNGADTFLFEAVSAFNDVDTIKDFSLTDGDAIHIIDLLIGFDAQQSAIDDFVMLTESGGDTTLAVDRDGTSGTYSAQNVATIDNVTGLDADDMLTNGHLIAA